MNAIKYLLMSLIIFSCGEKKTNKTEINVEKGKEVFCAIETESDFYIKEILKEHEVNSILKSANAFGINNVKIDGNINFHFKKIDMDSFSVTLSDSIKTKKDLILTIKKKSCHSGTFHLTAVPKSFSIDGNFHKISPNQWIAKSTSYVEIN
jgi:hypothetical protein